MLVKSVSPSGQGLPLPLAIRAYSYPQSSRTAQPRAIRGVSCAELAESSSSSKGRFGLISVGSDFLGCCSARL